MQDRIDRIAEALCLEPTEGGFGLRSDRDGRWWITGGRQGDVVLPQLRGLALASPLESAEAWLADQE